jgi:hypothetical protein
MKCYYPSGRCCGLAASATLLFTSDHWTVHLDSKFGYVLTYHSRGPVDPRCSSICLGRDPWYLDRWCNPRHGGFRGHACPPYPTEESVTTFMSGVWWREVMCGDALEMMQ